MKQPLGIYIASAGAGKTHNLTERYLALALQKDFSSIQAVTFTNKATEEMKERIIKELHKIAVEPLEKGGKRCSDFFDKLCKTLEVSSLELRERARATLRNMLLNYGRFRVKTIDAFFQEVLRSFAREINISGGFRLQLEADLALEAAVVGVLSEQDNLAQKHLGAREWITILAKELILNGEGHNLKREIMRLASELKREPVKQLSLAGKFPSQDSLIRFKRYLLEQEEVLSRLFIEQAREIFGLLSQVGVQLEDTKNGSSGGLAPLKKLACCQSSVRPLLQDPKFVLLSKRFLALVTDPSELFAKKSSKGAYSFNSEAKIAELQELGLWRQLKEYQRLACEVGPILHSIYRVQSLLNSYGLISEVDRKLKEQQRSANALLLSDAPSLINAILSDGSGVQFIYEKLGTRLEHQMIDEFQDTSLLQYQNFCPLFKESIASGNENLVVGDLKQSIYRFRNSDSNLLATQVKRDFEGQTELITLSENWRSVPEIINFNNFLFAHIPTELTKHYIQWSEELRESNFILRPDRARELAQSFVRYYEGHEQNLPKARQGKHGAVAVHEMGYDETGDLDLSGVPKVIIDLQRRGYRPCDIAILVRDRAQAKLIAEVLQVYAEASSKVDYSLEVISSEALRVDTARSVRCLIAALEYILRPTSRQREHLLQEAYKQMTGHEQGYLECADLERILEIGRLSLYEVVEGLFAEWRGLVESGEVPYQIKVLDMALNFQQDLSADISDFLTMWYERGNKQTLVIPDDEHKVRLMTIHKSKGLGFPVVLLPFPSWDLIPSSPQQRPILWCDNSLGMQEEIAQLPVHFSPSLTNTLFVNEYLEESIKMSLDALNLLYVATTRAQSELHLWIVEEDTVSETKKTRVASSSTQKFPRNIFDLLLPQLHAYKATKVLDQDIYWIGLGQEIEIDVRHKTLDEAGMRQTLDIGHLHAYSVGSRIEILREGLEHFDINSPRIYGRLMHSILSGIRTVEDVPMALLKAEHEGLFVGRDRGKYEKELMSWIGEIEYPWFSSEVKVLRELPIIGGQLETSRRPDRVVLYPDGSVDVVDYKFGNKSKAYVRQVKMYQSLIMQMGYTTVRGYIWYVLQGQVLAI
ncbi:MAG: UvrD-helicase domain-containing protein [Porphyromonadaceae bacterium]|nr:UvrD-helicase domain-containing protein [Porphyromonadaceae bacterium]